jgi:hypothetical protein
MSAYINAKLQEIFMDNCCKIACAALLFAAFPCSSAESKLIIKSGFEPSTNIPADISDIKGIDASTGHSWDDNPAWIEKSNFVYIISGGKKAVDFMNSEIVEMTGPKGDTTKVLHMQNKLDDPDNSSTSRNEYSLFASQSGTVYAEGYVRYCMKLQDNLDEIIPLDKNAGWYMIMEWKEPNSGIKYSDQQCADMAGCSKVGSNNYRINIGIDKEAGSNKLFWIINGEAPQPCRCREWTIRNKSVPVPLGAWFLVEAYMKKHASDGRVYFAVNGTVVCDTTCRTQHKDNPLPLKFWSIFKLYHGEDWRANGPTNQWYDDLEVWDGFPPVHSHIENMPSVKASLRAWGMYPADEQSVKHYDIRGRVIDNARCNSGIIIRAFPFSTRILIR